MSQRVGRKVIGYFGYQRYLRCSFDTDEKRRDEGTLTISVMEEANTLFSKKSFSISDDLLSPDRDYINCLWRHSLYLNSQSVLCSYRSCHEEDDPEQNSYRTALYEFISLLGQKDLPSFIMRKSLREIIFMLFFNRFSTYECSLYLKDFYEQELEDKKRQEMLSVFRAGIPYIFREHTEQSKKRKKCSILIAGNPRYDPVPGVMEDGKIVDAYRRDLVLSKSNKPVIDSKFDISALLSKLCTSDDEKQRAIGVRIHSLREKLKERLKDEVAEKSKLLDCL